MEREIVVARPEQVQLLAEPQVEAAPDWVHDSYLAALRELRLFAATAAHFILHPQRSAELWGRGALRALNPLGFLATSMMAVGVARAVGLSALGMSTGDSLAEQLLTSVGPFLHYAALGLICHLVLRALSERRRRATDSLGITLYAAGGPGAAAELLVWTLVLLGSTFAFAGPGTLRMIAWLGLGVALGAFCNALGGGLGVLHRSKWWHMLLAFAAALVGTGLFFGAVDPPGQYGIHWVLTLFDAQGAFRVRLGLGL